MSSILERVFDVPIVLEGFKRVNGRGGGWGGGGLDGFLRRDGEGVFVI